MPDDLNEQLAEFGMRLEFWPVDDLVKLANAPANMKENPKKHFNFDIAALASAFEDVGFKGVCFVNKEGTKLPAGKGRVLAAARTGKFKTLPVFRILDLNTAKLKKFALGDNKLRSDKYDEKILLEQLQEIVNAGEPIAYLDYGQYEKQLAKDMAAEEVQLAQAIESISAEEAVGDVYRAPGGPVGGAAPDMGPVGDKSIQMPSVDASKEIEPWQAFQFPAEPTWDIPLLSMKYMQKDGVPTPFVKWGEVSQKSKQVGCWHCYVDDQKFEPITRDARAALYSSATCFVECNFSTYADTPLVVGLYDIYRKRRVSRLLQSRSMNIIVDVNVDPKFYPYALLGVPYGWTAYATRGLSSLIHLLDTDFKMCCERAQTDDILFVVYGGGKDVAKKAEDNGWHWFPERMAEVSGSAPNKSGLGLKVDPSEYKDLS